MARKKLLVVEDDPGLQRQLRWTLDGYEVVFASEREMALNQLRRHQPAVATIDLGLPPETDSAGEGLALLKQMLAIAPGMKVIVLSGNQDIQGYFRHRSRSKRTGLQSFLFRLHPGHRRPKPVLFPWKTHPEEKPAIVQHPLPPEHLIPEKTDKFLLIVIGLIMEFNIFQKVMPLIFIHFGEYLCLIFEFVRLVGKIEIMIVLVRSYSILKIRDERIVLMQFKGISHAYER